MVDRIHGIASAFQSVTGGLQYYTVWVSSPNAFSDPSNATGVNIAVTGNIQDESQKCFEVLVQSVGLRAMPALMNDPVAVEALENVGATVLTGEGFVWRFASDRSEVFATSTNPVGLLVEELNGIVLPNGTILDTAGAGQNIEFIRSEQL